MNKLRKRGDCPNAWFTYLENCGPQTKYAYWKPSEEQMKALVAVTKNLFAEMPERHRLESLYNDLKRL